MREEEEKRDIERIEAVFEESDRIWGYRNITKELQSRGMEISEYRVRRLMKENGFYPELAVKFKPQRNGKKDGRYYENKVNQEFKVKEKNKVWAGDITYIKTKVGWVYLAVVIDLFNREIIGYDLGKKIDSQLVKNALGNAIGRRGIKEGLILIHQKIHLLQVPEVKVLNVNIRVLEKVVDITKRKLKIHCQRIQS